MSDKFLGRALAVLLWPSPAILLVILGVIVWAGHLTISEPGDLRGPYVVLLLCQSFAASTGFARRARRGHFDQILAGRTRRLPFAIGHASVSVAFGVLAWVIVSVLDALGGGGHWPLGLTPRAVAAFLYVSAIAWGLSVPFTRYTAGLVWLIVMVGLAASGRLVGLRSSYANANDTWAGTWQSTGAVLLFPPFLVGDSLHPPALLVSLVLLAAATAASVGVWFISWSSLQLEDVE